MGPWARYSQRLDLRPERCPPLEHAHSQDPRYVLNTGLFLGLFDVTHRGAVAVAGYGTGFDTVWHCFDTVLTYVPSSISMVGRSHSPIIQ